MYRPITLCVLTVLLFATCRKEYDNGFLDLFDTEQHVTLTEAMPELKDKFQKPTLFYWLNQYILFAEPKTDSLLFVYDSQTNQSKCFFPKGQAQNEAISIRLNRGKDPNSCSVYDNALQKAYLFSLDDRFVPSIETDSLMPKGSMKTSIVYDDTLAFYEHVGNEHRFTAITPHKTIHFGNDITIKNLSPSTLTKVLQGPCSLSASQKRLFWFASFGDVFEIYDYSNIDSIKTVCSLTARLPHANRNGALTPEDKLGVTYVTSNDQYIYALYVGKTINESVTNRENALYTDKILVFDWDGNPCKVLRLDREVSAIAYSERYDKLYCLGVDDDLNYTLYVIDNI